MRATGTHESLQSSGSFSEFGVYKQDTCSICLEKYGRENPAMMYTCGHAFHLQCAESWRQRRVTCPMCWEVLEEAQLYTGSCKVQESFPASPVEFTSPLSPLTPDDLQEEEESETDALLPQPATEPCGPWGSTSPCGSGRAESPAPDSSHSAPSRPVSCGRVRAFDSDSLSSSSSGQEEGRRAPPVGMVKFAIRKCCACWLSR
eukprot:TRINITY_DN65779_c0_g1_i1.p2 TRINITY_DN65779_c0_g1~~TRINITY_DN65779_c0_g1_i1.p2  ORF type:complete len:203 (+),score=33.73 TRINITY_DN65779_c0_g1_i1:621-1229(+)